MYIATKQYSESPIWLIRQGHQICDYPQIGDLYVNNGLLYVLLLISANENGGRNLGWFQVVAPTAIINGLRLQ